MRDLVPTNIEEGPEKWDVTRLPEVLHDMKNVDSELMVGANNIDVLLNGFKQFMEISKKITSKSTKRNYTTNAKQFLVWCNSILYSIQRITTTQELRNIVIVYNYVLTQSYKQQNTIALKMQSMRKFFEFINFEKLTMDISSAFDSNWVTTQDPDAFKRQVRISDQVYDAVMEVANAKGNINHKWILFFLAYGCRRSEIAGAKVENIDMINSCIHLYQIKTKRHKKLPLPIWFTGLDMFFHGQVYIIYNDSKRTNKTKGVKPVSEQHIYDITNRWLTQTIFAGKVKITPHSFRRYFVGSMKVAGYSDSSIADMTGHVNLNQVAKYGYDDNIGNNPIVKDHAVKH